MQIRFARALFVFTVMWIFGRLSTVNDFGIKTWISVHWNMCFVCGFFKYLCCWGRTCSVILFYLTGYILRGVNLGSTLQVRWWEDNIIINANFGSLSNFGGVILDKNICRSCETVATLNIWIVGTFICLNITPVSTRESYVFINVFIYWIFDECRAVKEMIVFTVHWF